eukprot:NODE_1032_length_1906_cov_0.115108.p1 type:complete len:203 gc:universal NODE_1032_length_1906_cov_0.115108:1456-848(-)
MKRTLIFLHGLGDRGSSWSELKHLFNGYKCIFPDAPVMPVHVNGNQTCPSWYNLYQLGEGREDQEGLLKTKEYLYGLIKKEINDGVNAKNIFIGGFSQGAVVSLLTGLTIPLEIGGVIALSGYLPIRYYIMKQQLTNVPIYMAHGTMDPVISYDMSQKSKKVLLSLNLRLTYKSYQGMEHTATPEELQDVIHWLDTLNKDEL